MSRSQGETLLREIRLVLVLVIENPFAEEAEARWAGEYRESVKRFGLLSDQQQEAGVARGESIRDELAVIFLAGSKPEDDTTQNLIKAHYEWVCLFWTPNREQYIGLGEMYASDSRFTDYYDVKANGLTDFLGKAIRVWSETNL